MFKNDDTYGIIIISLAAGGCGLNLTEANHVFVVDPWWNPAVEDQAIERVHRIGQKKEVFVTRFLMLNSIEERMHQICLQKKDLFDNIMKGKNLPEKE
jgi:SNF2 family DNA or RNA helicase